MKIRMLGALLWAGALTPAANAGVIENFENYAVGSNLHGQGGWAGWDNAASAGALVSDARAFSGTKSVNITGGSDLVRTFSGVTNGVWTFRLKQYVPSGSTGTNYVILLNQYRDGAAGDVYKWSVQTQNQLNNGKVVSEFGGSSTDLVKDAWVEYRFDIDLDSGTVSEYYNNVLLGSYVWQDGTGVNALRALDLFANGAGPVYYDDLVVTPAFGTGQDLQLRVAISLSDDLGIPPNSMFNPRYFDGDIYANQINAGGMSFGRYTSGSPIPTMLVNNSAAGPEHRMVAPFRGEHKSRYLLGSSSAAASTTTMSRYDFNGSNRVDVATPFNMIVEGFDWVDTNTIITTIYTSGNRKRLYLVDVIADPFSMTLNTTWNPEGFVTTGVSTRIRNVRTGDVYNGYAYYGDSGQNSNPNFYALNLATGVETLLGNAGTLTGTGSFGVWTVLERDGLLYVQTTDNGIQIYTMTSATTLGPLVATYSKEEIDAVTSSTGQHYGLDVTPNGKTFVLAAVSRVFEFGPPHLGVGMAGSDLILSWPTAVNGMVIQSASSLTSTFTDMDPQPTPSVEGKLNKVSIPTGANQAFFRLRKGP